MICAVVNGPSFKAVYEQIKKALPHVDLVELRLDLFETNDLNALKQLRQLFSLPMIFTLRTAKQGGSYLGTQTDYMQALRSLLMLKPEYLDIESGFPIEFFQEIHSSCPETELICSYHDFKGAPHDLKAIYTALKEKPASFYKIALTAENSIDTLKLLIFAKNKDKQLMAISMGPKGQISRILSPIMGNPITYASITKDTENALGQLSAEDLIDVYRFHSLSDKTKIYGLIGEVVSQSPSHVSHNALMKMQALDAVYVKIPVKPKELVSFLALAKKLPFSGLSVTMPLKEKILPFLDEIDPQAKQIGAVNTLVFEKGKITGFNTDGLGALDAIETRVKVAAKKVVIIGAGGAARAIAYEACKRGANVTVLSRDVEKARFWACSLNFKVISLDKVQECFLEGYDLLINCTPLSLPIDPSFLISSAFIMDITTTPKESLLLQKAKQRGCQLIYGYQMFIEQAIWQFDIWFNHTLPLSVSRKIIEEAVLKHLD